VDGTVKTGSRTIYELAVPGSDPEATLKKVFAHWLEEKKLDAILVPAISKTGAVTRSLVSAPEKIMATAPLLPAMGINGAGIIAEIAPDPGAKSKIGVLLRPCELRAVVELVKLQQVSLDGIVLVGIDCPGTYKTAQFLQIAEGASDFNNNFIRNQDAYTSDSRLRHACQLCEFPAPLVFDIMFGFLGMNPDEELLVITAGEKGAVLLAPTFPVPLEPRQDEPAARVEFINKLRRAREEAIRTQIRELDERLLGAENVVRYFADCLNCHNCMKVCPVCYCRECFFESDALNRNQDEFVRFSRSKGMVRMPSGTLLFHITRMNHMMTSCVQCGICEDSCPVSIGLSVLFKKVSRNAQNAFGYLSGRALEEPLPLTTFREDEFTTIGEG